MSDNSASRAAVVDNFEESINEDFKNEDSPALTLMTLPKELRLEILEYVLSFSELEFVLVLHDADSDYRGATLRDHGGKFDQSCLDNLSLKFYAERYGTGDKSSMNAAVIRTCKALREEALPLFFQHNFITFQNPSTLPLLLRYKEQNNLANFKPWTLIRHIALDYDMIKETITSLDDKDLQRFEGFGRKEYNGLILSDLITSSAPAFMKRLTNDLINLRCLEVHFTLEAFKGEAIESESIDERIAKDPMVDSLIDEMERFKKWYKTQKTNLKNGSTQSDYDDLISKWTFKVKSEDFHVEDYDLEANARTWFITWTLDSMKTEKLFLADDIGLECFLGLQLQWMHEDMQDQE